MSERRSIWENWNLAIMTIIATILLLFFIFMFPAMWFIGYPHMLNPFFLLAVKTSFFAGWAIGETIKDKTSTTLAVVSSLLVIMGYILFFKTMILEVTTCLLLITSIALYKQTGIYDDVEKWFKHNIHYIAGTGSVVGGVVGAIFSYQQSFNWLLQISDSLEDVLLSPYISGIVGFGVLALLWYLAYKLCKLRDDRPREV